MKILICGSRGWNDPGPIRALILERMAESAVHNEPFVVIHGNASKGADRLADQVCLDLGMQPGHDLIRVDAEWNRYGRAAGPIRNERMLKENPDEVHAFRAHGKSNGTDDMCARARDAGITPRVHAPVA